MHTRPMRRHFHTLSSIEVEVLYLGSMKRLAKVVDCASIRIRDKETLKMNLKGKRRRESGEAGGPRWYLIDVLLYCAVLPNAQPGNQVELQHGHTYGYMLPTTCLCVLISKFLF